MDITISDPYSGTMSVVELLPNDTFDIFKRRVLKELGVTAARELTFAGDPLDENDFPGPLCAGSEVEVHLTEEAQAVITLRGLGIVNPSANVLQTHIQSKQLDTIPLLIKAGAAQRSHVIAACENNLVDVVRMLIEIDLSRSKHHLSEALHVSVVKGYKEITKMLVKKDVYPAGAFRAAVLNSDYEAAEIIIEHCENLQESDFKKLLPEVAMTGNLEMVKYVVGLFSKTDCEFPKALVGAVEQGHLEVVTYLLDFTNPDSEYKGRYPLSEAIKNGRIQIAELLISKGVDAKDKKYSDTIFRYAIETGNPDVVKFVLSVCNPTGICQAFSALERSGCSSTTPSRTGSIILSDLLDFCISNDLQLYHFFEPYAYAVHQRVNASLLLKVVQAFRAKTTTWSDTYRCDALTMACDDPSYIDIPTITILLAIGAGDGGVDYRHMAMFENTSYKATPIIGAVSCGRDDVLGMILDAYPKPNYIDVQGRDGKTALSIAAGAGNLKMIELLIKHGASLTTNRQHDPITTAIREKQFEATKLLASKGCDLASVKLSDVASTSPAILQLLIDSLAKDKLGRPVVCPKVLVKAIYETNRENVEVLLKNGVDPNRRGEESYNALYPIQITACTGDLAIAELLIEFGAMVDVRTAKMPTALSIAAAEGNADIVELLIKHGADSDAKKGEATALFRAVKRGHTAVVSVLLRCGKVNVDNATTLGKTPFSSACCKGYHDIVQLLLDANADINKACNEGITPMERAVMSGHDQIVTLLLDRNAVVNQEAPIVHRYYTQYIDAVRCISMPAVHPSYYLGLLKRFLANGANPNIKHPLHQAIIDGECAVVELLLNHGADCDLKNTFGYTPLHMAAGRGRLSIASMLLDKGADPTITYERSGEEPVTALGMISNQPSQIVGEMTALLTDAEAKHKTLVRQNQKRPPENNPISKRSRATPDSNSDLESQNDSD